MSAVLESDLENAALAWFGDLGYEHFPADHLNPESPYQERASFEEVLLRGRLEEAIRRLNPELDEPAIGDVLRRLLRRDAPGLAAENAAFHRHLVDGVEIEIAGKNGGVRGTRAQLIDFDHPEEDDWVVARQVSVVDRRSGTGQPRIADLVVYVNGLPLGVLELKNPADANAGIEDAYHQLQTYKLDVPSLFVANAVLVISDDVHARIGSLTADESRFGLWRTVSGEGDEPKTAQPLEVLIRGVFDKERFLDLVRNFVTFESDRGRVVKKVAGYHQFHAVRRALVETLRATAQKGDRRIGVVWHTQGSGKSLSMLFYARKLILEPRLENPTLVVLTDRNDLDGQLFGTFAMSEALLRQKPIQANDRAHLRELLRTASGGVYFTTIQKFLPEPGDKSGALSDRRNIVVIADEAHRSQYGFKGKLDTKTGELVYGLAKHMRVALPNASFIGFTGTPIELADKNTVQVFGDTISRYDIQRAVEDKATVPIFYENRLAKLDLDEREKPKIDPTFEEITEGEEIEHQEALKSEWSTLEALVGTEKRLRLIARDLVAHFEKRCETMEGKALVVCMSRQICVDLHKQIVELRPHWFDEDDDAGAIKVVMTGSASDGPAFQPHVRSKARRDRIAERFKDPKDPLRLVIVRDMWLTGFDAPCMHTLYVDKPMRGHNLMQAIARVNRVFGDKPGGLVVDYIGIATFLREALKTYAESGGRGDPANQQEQAVRFMLEHLERCRDVFHGFDYQAFFSGKPEKRLALLPPAREHVLAQRAPVGESSDKPKEGDGYDRFLKAVAELTSAFALAMPHDACEEHRDEIAFFQAVRAGLAKLESGKSTGGADLTHAVRQIVANAIVTSEVIDVFSAAGLQRPDISILSPEFLAEIEGMKHKNLAAAVLKRLLQDEVRLRLQNNVVQGRRFSELLEKAVLRYQNRSIESVQVIEELIDLAKKMRESDDKEKSRKLSREESAFYDALADNESAVDVLGDEKLAFIARELTACVRTNATIDWTQKESAQAKLRILLKGVLKKYGYPPDMQKKATELVLEQAKQLGINVVSGGSEKRELRGQSEPPAAAERELPYPIAVFDSLIAAQESGALRIKTRRDAFEKVLTFVAAVALGLLAEENGGKLPESALKLLKKFLGKPLTMGAWLTLVCDLAAALPEARSGTDPLVRAVRGFTTPNGKPSPLALEIKTLVVEERNVFSHQITVAEEVLLEAEDELRSLWQRLEKALSGLAQAQFVSKAKILDLDQDGKNVRYEVRQLHGGSSHFAIREQTIRGRLEDGWCYALRDGAAPMPLAPLVSCSVDDTGTRDVCVAREIELGAGKLVHVYSLSRAGSAKVKTPR